MSVKINIHPALAQFTNDRRVVEVDGSTVGECLEQLVARFPKIKESLLTKDGELAGWLDIFVNEEPSFPDELKRRVKPGDELDLVMLISGG